MMARMVHLVVMLPGHRMCVRMVWMVLRVTTVMVPVVLLTVAVPVLQGGMVLHVLRWNVLLGQVRWSRTRRTVATASAACTVSGAPTATAGIGLHGLRRWMMCLPTAPDAGAGLRRGWRVRRCLARTGGAELRVRGTRG